MYGGDEQDCCGGGAGETAGEGEAATALVTDRCCDGVRDFLCFRHAVDAFCELVVTVAEVANEAPELAVLVFERECPVTELLELCGIVGQTVGLPGIVMQGDKVPGPTVP